MKLPSVPSLSRVKWWHLGLAGAALYFLSRPSTAAAATPPPVVDLEIGDVTFTSPPRLSRTF